MVPLLILFLAVVMAIFGEMCAESDARAVEIATLQEWINGVEARLRELEERPTAFVPMYRHLYRN